MDWVLLLVITSIGATDKVATTTTIPMATLELCNAGKAKVLESYKAINSPNFFLMGECLKTR